ncbi:MAG: chemotaxis protein CheB [Acidobacteria bacterium]|nr:chemotaxis protein CheB [Acidobacteriota bacterium]MCI0627717.1 chemotaxis protein CheB [Acidobacteriota bacterium]MCI0722430.1 chemotaxis protein CheB [Acidobacteriota bacterium]
MASGHVCGRDARAPSAYRIVVIGASLGGTKAVSALLSALPGHFPVPLAIVLHRGVDSDATLRDLLQSHSTLAVLEAEDKMEIVAGHAYLSPANYHLLVGRTGFSLSTEAPVAFARPAIDILFESASATYGSKTLGVLLTGASTDGALGAAKIRERGGFVVVQDPATAESPIMPQAAIEAGAASAVLSLHDIPACLDGLSQRKNRG